MYTIDKDTKRSIRVFISSTFRDMIAERDKLMADVWPQLRKLCQERYVELVEVDMRWGITEAQSSQKETLKLCLDEIRDCRPFFIGLLGERYGWTPGEDSFTKDLLEEQKWLNEPDNKGKSVTELEIIHGVLRNPEMAGRAFYFRDPVYSKDKGSDFQSETPEDAEKQEALKNEIRKVCEEKHIPLKENYSDPDALAQMVLDDLTAAINAQYPKEDVPDQLTREAQGHEAFAAARRKTYIGRNEYFATLDHHAAATGVPLVLLGESGSGKSALLANWVAHWREKHPKDYIFQHYIGGTTDSSDHYQLMKRLMGEIKRWSDDPDVIPTDKDDILRYFPLWLAKARAKAEKDGIRFIVVLDALNQLNDYDHALLLGWLPEHALNGGPLRLITSTLPGKENKDDPLAVAKARHWQELTVNPLDTKERIKLIDDYLLRFGKKLDTKRKELLANALATENPLYLKILLDDLRVTGTHDKLDDKLNDYLKAADIPALLSQLINRWQRDYEKGKPNLVSDSLSLIFAARRGLSETELLELLRRADKKEDKLPPAVWSPLRAVLDDFLLERGGVLNFAHDYLRMAVEKEFVPDIDVCDDFRLKLADYFEAQPITPRSCDELPWLLKETESFTRLRDCLLDIDRFLVMIQKDEEELRGYWIDPLKQQQTMGQPYLESFAKWEILPDKDVGYGAGCLGFFLDGAALYKEAEPLHERALAIREKSFGPDHPDVATSCNNLALLYRATNRYAEAESLYERALAIREKSFGPDHPAVATSCNNLALLYEATNRYSAAEPIYERALSICEKSFGPDHPSVATSCNNLALLYQNTNRYAEAEPLLKRSLEIRKQSWGKHHPSTANGLVNLGRLIFDLGRESEAESLVEEAINIWQHSQSPCDPRLGKGYLVLGLIEKHRKNLSAAKEYLNKSLELLKQNSGTYSKEIKQARMALDTLL